MRRIVQVRRLWPLLAVALLLAPACDGGDGPTDTGPCEPREAPGGPANPGDLVKVLHNAWLEVDPDALELILSNDYVFEFYPPDADSANVYATWTRAQELGAHQNLLGGGPGMMPYGLSRPPVSPLLFSFFLVEEDESDWQPRSDPPYEGTLSKSFEIQPLINIGYDGLTDFDWGQGFQEFFVEEVEFDLGCGQSATEYRLKFWRDKGFVAAPSKEPNARRHVVVTWGYLRAIFGDKPDNFE